MNIKKSKVFRFQQFDIVQDYAAMKVGTDSILLGAISVMSSARHILDIGSGTGLLSLMLAQGAPDANIDAVEIDDNAMIDLKHNIANSQWSRRIKAYHMPIQKFCDLCAIKYDLICCNPPYYKPALPIANHHRSTARYNTSLPLDMLLTNIAQVLHQDGSAWIILPMSARSDLVQYLSSSKLSIIREIEIQPKITSPPNRIIVQLSLNVEQIIHEVLIVYGSGDRVYSDQFIELTKEYYSNDLSEYYNS